MGTVVQWFLFAMFVWGCCIVMGALARRFAPEMMMDGHCGLGGSDEMPQERRGESAEVRHIKLQLDKVLARADRLRARGLGAGGRRPEAADKWIAVLDIRSDHEEAMQNVVEYFMERKMIFLPY